MPNRTQLTRLDDYFLGLSRRKSRGVYFYRLNGTSPQIHDFIRRYFQAARQKGVIIEGKIPNPDNANLSYYSEIMGMSFQMSPAFIGASLQKWLPRMNSSSREAVTLAVFDTLAELSKAGKNENMLKNVYIKFMCWLYYKFERIVNHLGDEDPPKILYEGQISQYELLLMNVLSLAGCDILLLQLQGDAAYQKVDPAGSISFDLKVPGLGPFPEGFGLKAVQEEIRRDFDRERLYGPKPRLKSCTNLWMKGEVIESLLSEGERRGSEPDCYYNCFVRLTGVWDRLTYQNDLYQLQLELRSYKRKLLIINGKIPPASPSEIQAVKRNNYANVSQLVMDLSAHLRSMADPELDKLFRKAFVDLLLAESRKEGMNLNRLMVRAVYLICWHKRYESLLFGGFKLHSLPLFFHMGGCQDENEALFCSYLARLPVDVVLFRPDPGSPCCLNDPLILEKCYSESLPVRTYPEDQGGARAATSAYHAERDLDTLLYRDSGIYRDQQYQKANALCLQTIYEEIPILWDQELKYRPNFSAGEASVTMPVICAKVCGVKNGDLPSYWRQIQKLLTQDTVLIKSLPHISRTAPNPVKAAATEFFRNGRLQRSRIREHKAYPYGFLREGMQEHLLDKLQLLIDRKLIKGTFENGTEYTVVATALNLDKSILRLLQKFDFTKKNPKLVFVLPGEVALSLEDTIFAFFLALVGFDVLFFVPTGYLCIEKYLNQPCFEEHQIGEYLYDLQIPDFNKNPEQTNSRPSLRDLFFKRG